MAADGEVGFVVDSDKNAETGERRLGLLLGLNGGKQWIMFRWDGAAWVEAASTTVKVYVFDDVVYFGLDRAELGNTASFDFVVDASKYAGDQVVARDAAPDGDAYWTYATVTKTYGLVASPIVPGTQGGARAGKAFVAGYASCRTDSPRAGQRAEDDLCGDPRYKADSGPRDARRRGRSLPGDRAEDLGGEDHGREAAEADAEHDRRRQDRHEVVLDEDQGIRSDRDAGAVSLDRVR